MQKNVRNYSFNYFYGSGCHESIMRFPLTTSPYCGQIHLYSFIVKCVLRITTK